MAAPFAPELLFLVLWLALAFGVYWLIRLAVRHGVMDAQRRLPGVRNQAANQSAGGAAPTATSAD